MAGLEGFEFEFDGDQPPEVEVEGKQVEPEILAFDDNAFLPFDEREAAADFEDETLQFAEDRRFEITLAGHVLEAQEVQEIRVMEDQIRSESILVPKPGQFLLGQFGGILRRGWSTEEHPADFLAEVRTLQSSMRHISA